MDELNNGQKQQEDYFSDDLDKVDENIQEIEYLKPKPPKKFESPFIRQ